MPPDGEGLSRRDRLSLDAAKLYHLGGMSQQEVADHLHVSRPQVSKLLATATRKRYVRTVVTDPRESDRPLIAQLAERFHLTDVRLVVPVGRGPVDRCRALGTAAADMLDAHAVSDRHVLGFWWPGTGQYVLESMERAGLRPRDLVQLDGTDEDGRTSPSLAAFSERSEMPLRQCPEHVVHASIAARLEAEARPEVRHVLELQSQCDIVVVDAFPPEPDALPDSPLITAEERMLVQDVAVGRICGRFVDAEGRVVAPSLSQRVLGPTLSDLRRIKRTVLVAGGPDLVPVIRAALLNRYANHLVTDVETARTLALSD